MRIRVDSVFVSSVLHTIALLSLVRAALWNYFATSDKAVLAQMDAGLQKELQISHYLGVDCLAIILIGLIVLWTGYIKRSRSAWFVMFVIVWFWVFPVFIRPLVVPLARGDFMGTIPEFFYHAISGPGMITQMVRSILMFLIMVVGLALPMGRFFIARKANVPVHLPSRRLAVSLLIGIPVAALALYCWLRVGVLYELPTGQANMSLVAPPPPPLPSQLWLSSSADEKYGYAGGYLTGFQGGKRLACSFYEGKIPAYLAHKPLLAEKLPQQVCMTSLPYLVETDENTYVDTITNYYTKYPQDQEAEVSNILDEMATPPGLTDIDQIHAKLGGDAKRH